MYVVVVVMVGYVQITLLQRVALLTASLCISHCYACYIMFIILLQAFWRVCCVKFCKGL